MSHGYTLQELADQFGLAIQGDASVNIEAVATVEEASLGTLCFVANPKYEKHLRVTNASAAIVSPALAADCLVPALIADNPYLAFAKISQLFSVLPKAAAGIHPSAVVGTNVSLGKGVCIAPNAVIEADAVIGNDVVIGAGTIVGSGAKVGCGTYLHANVTLYHGVQLGESCVVHSGTVIGSDGFGFAPTGSGWQAIAQNGSVRIGDRVHIGANNCIDRGAIADTVIGNDVIIDNLVQIAHNVTIGDRTAMAATAGIAGSSKVGADCMLGGGAAVVGHLEIANGVTLNSRALATKSILQPGVYASGTPLMEAAAWRKAAVRFSKLDELFSRVNKLFKASK